MKWLNDIKNYFGIRILVIFICIANSNFAQTSGSMTLTFNPIAHTSYAGTKSVMAVWVETSSGSFVKTLVRYAGWGTKDHLPAWAVNAGGSAWNCMTGCNTVDAITGATLLSFSPKNIVWNGTDVNGDVVADDTYKVLIQETWNHGSTGTSTRTFTFTKGPNLEEQTPADDSDFSNITLTWKPSAAGVEEIAMNAIGVKLFPNPSQDGLVNVSYSNATSLTVINLSGELIFQEYFEQRSQNELLDLSAFSDGIYLVKVSNGANTTIKELVLHR